MMLGEANCTKKKRSGQKSVVNLIPEILKKWVIVKSSESSKRRAPIRTLIRRNDWRRCRTL
jgi:hypothetical protein